MAASGSGSTGNPATGMTLGQGKSMDGDVKGCDTVELVVVSWCNGKRHESDQYIYIFNMSPEFL